MMVLVCVIAARLYERWVLVFTDRKHLIKLAR